MTNKPDSSSASRTLFAAVLETKNYIVGEANAPSGLYRRGEGEWTHTGWRNLRCAAVAVDASTPKTIFLASGNGVLRSRDGGTTWRVTTDWRVAEVLDVMLDPFQAGAVFAASAYGLWHSADAGESWDALPPAAPYPNATFTPALALDRTQPGRLLVGTEAGLFVSEDAGQSWTSVGPRMAVRALEQSETQPAVWLAGTDGAGILRSADGGATWSASESGATIYAVALDPSDPRRMAATGFETGLLVTTDGGASWTQRPLDIEAQALHALAFDPDGSGRLWLGSVGEGVFFTDDLGLTCEDAGLPETTVYDFAFAAA